MKMSLFSKASLLLLLLFALHAVIGLYQPSDLAVKEVWRKFKRNTVIVGGNQAAPKEFPFMARLGNRNSANQTKWFCGGTLIGQRLILTAAHCLYSELGAINVVRLGELDFATDLEDADPEDFGVRKATEHPGFQNYLLYNDIAVIELDRTVNYNVYKRPACLPLDDGSRHENFIAIGWGHKKFAGNESTELLKVTLNNFGSRCDAASDIEELPRGYDNKTQLCVGSNLEKDTCNGDSGGPLLTFHGDKRCIIGVTSTGIDCGTPNVPSLYTRVHYYLNWINQQLARVN